MDVRADAGRTRGDGSDRGLSPISLDHRARAARPDAGARGQPPVVRNPLESLGFEKSTYIAGRYLIEGQCLTDSYIKRYGVLVTEANITSVKKGIEPPVVVTSRHNLLTKLNNAKGKKDPKTLSSLKKKAASQKQREETRRKDNTLVAKKAGVKRQPRSKITARKAKKVLSTKR